MYICVYIYIYIYIYIDTHTHIHNHENDVSSGYRHWFCSKSCTWANYVQFSWLSCKQSIISVVISYSACKQTNKQTKNNLSKDIVCTVTAKLNEKSLMKSSVGPAKTLKTWKLFQKFCSKCVLWIFVNYYRICTLFVLLFKS